MKLSAWAKKQGISYMTAWRWFRDGQLPIPAEQMPTGTVIVRDEDIIGFPEAVALYARVSSADQRSDLDAQLGRLATFAAERKMPVVKAVGDFAGTPGGRTKQHVRSTFLTNRFEPKAKSKSAQGSTAADPS